MQTTCPRFSAASEVRVQSPETEIRCAMICYESGSIDANADRSKWMELKATKAKTGRQ
jgi:hypothetical protein